MKSANTASVMFASLPLDAIRLSTTNPRKHFDEKKMNDLRKSILAKGILVPLLVRPVNEHYEVIAGERRYRAAKELEFTNIPCIVRELTDEEALEAQVIENLQREDVHPLDEAEGYQQLIAKAGYDIEKLAAKVGKSSSYIAQRIKLNDLIEPAKKVFDDNKMTVTHAIMIARLQPSDQKRALQFALKTWQEYDGQFEYDNTLNPEMSDKSGENRYGYSNEPARTICSVNDLAEFIKERIHLDLRNAAFDTNDAALVPKAGSCLACPKRTGYNKELFSDITKEPDICTDHVCYRAKQEANLANVKARLKHEKKKFIEITADDRKPEGHAGALTERSIKKVTGKPCKHARIGIYIDSANKGEQIVVCIAKKECKQHWSEWQKQRSKVGGRKSDKEAGLSYEEKQMLLVGKQKKAAKRYRAVAEEMWKKIPDTLPKDFAQRIAKIVEDNLEWEFEAVKPKTMKLTPVQIINVWLLGREYDMSISYNGNINPEFYKAAKSLGVKFEVILQKISDEEKAEAKKQQKEKPESTKKENIKQ